MLTLLYNIQLYKQAPGEGADDNPVNCSVVGDNLDGLPCCWTDAAPDEAPVLTDDEEAELRTHRVRFGLRTLAKGKEVEVTTKAGFLPNTDWGFSEDELNGTEDVIL